MMETILAPIVAASIPRWPLHADTPRNRPLPLLEDRNARQLQLRALLAVTLDAHGGVPRFQSQEIRDGFLLACSMMGDEVRQLAAVLQNRLSQGHAA